ncbi:hypothetical protein pb186bvf_007165 [Paramecium bursaria]
MSHKYCRQIKTFDLFEKPIQLMFKNAESHRTLLGAVISLLLVFFILIIFGYNLIEIFQRINPLVVESIDYNQDPSIMLLPNNFSFQIGLQNDNSSLLFDETIFRVSAYLQTTTKLLVNGSTTINTVGQEIPLLRCELDTSQIDLDNNFYCIDWNQMSNLKLDGSPQSKVQTKMKVFITQCNNQTQCNQFILKLADIICQSQERIEQILSNSQLVIRVSSNLLNFANFLNPYLTYMHEIHSQPINTLTKLINIQIQPILTRTDLGVILEDMVIQNSYKIQQSSEKIKQKDQDKIIEIELRLNFLQNICQISYTKFQVVLGYVGGLWNVLFIITKFLYTPLSKLSYKLAIVNQLFNFEGCPDITSLKKIQIKTQISSDFVQEIITNRDENRTINNPTRYTKSGQTFHPVRRFNAVQQQAPEIVERDTKLSNQLQQQIRSFFNKSSRKIKLSFLELLTQFKIITSENKKDQFEYSVQSYQNNLDIINILQKLQELEKLKQILLNPSQLKLFEFLPKPIISIDPNSFNNKFVIGNQKNRYQKSIEAQSALRDILRNIDEPINQKLLSFMDVDTHQLLQLQQSRDKLQSPDSVQNEFINRPKPDIKINVRLVSSSDLEEQIYQQQEEEILQVKNV